MLEHLPIFVINLPRATARKERLIVRLKYHRIFEQTKFVEAVDKDSKEVENVTKDVKITNSDVMKVIACLLSHLKAIKEFVKTEKKYGIIMEDDCVFDRDFRVKFNRYWKSLTKKPNIMMLMHYVSDWKGLKIHPEGIGNITPTVWCAACYVISREYALKVLKVFEGKTLLKTGITPDYWKSEYITQNGEGVYVMEQLAVEESLSSYIQPDYQLQNHINYFKQYRYEKFVIPGEDAEVLKVWGIKND